MLVVFALSAGILVSTVMGSLPGLIKIKVPCTSPGGIWLNALGSSSTNFSESADEEAKDPSKCPTNFVSANPVAYKIPSIKHN